jgi:hypothetical protein
MNWRTIAERIREAVLRAFEFLAKLPAFVEDQIATHQASIEVWVWVLLFSAYLFSEMGGDAEAGLTGRVLVGGFVALILTPLVCNVIRLVPVAIHILLVGYVLVAVHAAWLLVSSLFS